MHKVAVHAVVVAVVTGKSSFERTEKVPIVLPAHRDRIADDVGGDVDIRVDFGQSVERQFDPPFRSERQHLHGIRHPGIGETDDAWLARSVVKQIGAAGQAIGQGHRHDIASGLRVLVLPKGAIDHDEGFRGLHITGAIQRHPKLLIKEAFFSIDRGGEQPALGGGDNG